MKSVSELTKGLEIENEELKDEIQTIRNGCQRRVDELREEVGRLRNAPLASEARNAELVIEIMRLREEYQDQKQKEIEELREEIENLRAARKAENKELNAIIRKQREEIETMKNTRFVATPDMIEELWRRCKQSGEGEQDWPMGIEWS